MPEQFTIHRHAEQREPASWRLAVPVVFLAVVLLNGLHLFVPLWGNSGWPDAVLLAVSIPAALAAFAGQIPAVNVFLAGVIAAGLGGIMHAINDATGLPFGGFEFRPEFGPRVFGILPVAMPVLWAVASLNARGVARRLLMASRSHPRHGHHVIALAAGLMAVFHLALTQNAVLVKSWWTPDVMPVLGLASCTVLSLIIQIGMTPLLLDKFPVPRPPNFSPVLVWVGMNSWLALGLLSKQIRIGGALALLAAQFLILIRGLRER